MGETLTAITGASKAFLLGRKTYEVFAPAWRERTVEDDPLGEGDRFRAEGEQNKLTLKAHDVYENGVVHLCYGPAAA